MRRIGFAVVCIALISPAIAFAQVTTNIDGVTMTKTVNCGNLTPLYTGQCSQSSPCSAQQLGMIITHYVPTESSDCNTMNGCFTTAKRGLNGSCTPITLDAVRLHQATYATCASNPANYGKFYNLGTISYWSALDLKKYTLNNVICYVQDTGSAFQSNTNKIDVASTACPTCSDQEASYIDLGEISKVSLAALTGMQSLVTAPSSLPAAQAPSPALTQNWTATPQPVSTGNTPTVAPQPQPPPVVYVSTGYSPTQSSILMPLGSSIGMMLPSLMSTVLAPSISSTPLETSEPQTCAPQYFCSGNYVIYRDNSCSTTEIEQCSTSCTDGACDLSPASLGSTTSPTGTTTEPTTTTSAPVADVQLTIEPTGTIEETASPTSSSATPAGEETIFEDVATGSVATDSISATIVVQIASSSLSGSSSLSEISPELHAVFHELEGALFNIIHTLSNVAGK